MQTLMDIFSGGCGSVGRVRIVIPVVVGSSPISHPIIPFRNINPIYLNPVEITLYSCVLMVACKMSLMGFKGHQCRYGVCVA